MTKVEFKHIYDQYFDSIRNYIFYRSGDSELATDIAQDAFLTFWRKQFEFDQKKNKNLLYKIASDSYASYYRKLKLESDYSDSMNLTWKNTNESPAIEYTELKEQYENILVKLDEKQRVVFLMSRMEELSYKEIANRLDISVKAVEKRMSKALKEFKKLLDI